MYLLTTTYCYRCVICTSQIIGSYSGGNSDARGEVFQISNITHFEGPRELGLRYPNPWFPRPSWAICDLPSLLPRLLVFSFKARTEVPCLALSKTYVFFYRLPSYSRGKPTLLGWNWRHGDIEDALLTLFLARVAGGHKFSKLDVQRVYFGNWIHDYSQAVDVGTLKYVSAEAICILIWVLGFMSFGQATEFSHYSRQDARDYDHRLRGPVDEGCELSVDPMTATEDIGIATTTGLVWRVFRRSIQLGRQYARTRNDEDLHEAFRLLGTGLHCPEDYAAYSNYTELSLIEMGGSDVGRNTKFELHGAQNGVYPVVTGTFGGGFFHSVLGELSDKVAQSEIQSLVRVITGSQSMTPAGLVDDSEAQANKMEEFRTQSENAKKKSQSVSPHEPEEWTCHLEGVHQQIHPVLEWHDEITKSINSAIKKIPVQPELVEQIQDHIKVFVFSVLAPYVLPIIKQVKVELQTGSSEIIQSSREQQHIVFENDESSNPTHSMLSKDHFSNVSNEPAGRVASQLIKWTVPQLMEIIEVVFHHPALREFGEDGAADVRQIMFHTVEEWWHGKTEEEQEYPREQLTRQGVFEGKNHKEGVHDTGHGCGKPLALRKGGHGNPCEPSGSDSSLGEAVAAAAGDGTLRGLVSGLEPYHEDASLEEQRPPWKVRHEHYDEGEWRGDHWNYEHESVERLEHLETKRYSDGNEEHRYGYDNRPVRNEHGDDPAEPGYD
ncbi:heterokaryon incompatibility protein Het-C-domain-containing protein [Aspergillus pseudotamarii]|uniref:Heterokaryon incompatibility protein Het-C-domain-containing protein n=1 Tax=Aspergillus pseudotamarii TaxID=132259 RepID=A0A5N6SKL4_ASPPS|nr:heterokaryon incompatibility protein Het-C-domain-containing protein [Aspergillus pseudotamarii]KAE8133933.1 heterokaryon incompatibility protein Het-C-domain-containing protein [Aspergillus pseudotamarii]